MIQGKAPELCERLSDTLLFFSSGNWTLGGLLNNPRTAQMATSLVDSSVLITGGQDSALTAETTVPCSTGMPSQAPSSQPTASPSEPPTGSPSTLPSGSPSEAPNKAPTGSPVTGPSNSPSELPTGSPSTSPSEAPTGSPSGSPSQSPSLVPTAFPSAGPTVGPSEAPTTQPTVAPTTGTVTCVPCTNCTFPPRCGCLSNATMLGCRGPGPLECLDVDHPCFPFSHAEPCCAGLACGRRGGGEAVCHPCVPLGDECHHATEDLCCSGLRCNGRVCVKELPCSKTTCERPGDLRCCRGYFCEPQEGVCLSLSDAAAAEFDAPGCPCECDPPSATCFLRPPHVCPRGLIPECHPAPHRPCCEPDCTFSPWSKICHESRHFENCDLPGYCTGRSGHCPYDRRDDCALIVAKKFFV